MSSNRTFIYKTLDVKPDKPTEVDPKDSKYQIADTKQNSEVKKSDKSIFRNIKDATKSIYGIFVHMKLWLESGFISHFYENKKNALLEDKTNEIAVYYVHGTADRPGSIDIIANKLIEDLPAEIASITAVSFDKRFLGLGIEAYTYQFKKQLETSGHKNIILMGHSRGALIAANFLVEHASELGINVLAYVSLGGPFFGSDFAFWPFTLISTSVGQMTHDSEFLKELREKMQTVSATTDMYFIAADTDRLVKVKDSFVNKCVEENKGSLSVISDHGHLSMMSSDRLVNKLKDVFNKSLQKLKEQNANASPSEANGASKNHKL